MRRFSDALPLVTAFLFALPGCSRDAEPAPEPAPSLRAAAPTPVASGSAGRPFIPRAPEQTGLPNAAHEPGYGLDATDPARDYVTRYLRASRRYGDKIGCVVVKPATFTGDQSVVETRNDASGACGAANELRDRFFVTVATDRMSLDPSLHQPKLQSWPDGSEPDGPPGKVSDLQDLRTFKTAALREAFRKLTLSPLRVQLYGRGSYPVISIAGWHGPVLKTMSPEDLAAPAKTLCDANDGEPLAIFAGLDRATILRVSCPGARFESL